RGLLRLSTGRGPAALEAEVSALRHLLRAAVHRSGETRDAILRTYCDDVSDVVHAGARAELARLRGENPPGPAFAGIVVELFEPAAASAGTALDPAARTRSPLP